MQPSLRIRHSMISAMDRYWEITVAQATPSTLMPSAITNTRFRHTLTRPAIVRMTSGRLVSPTARSTAAPKLYSMLKGMPIK